jgi:ribonuclease G
MGVVIRASASPGEIRAVALDEHGLLDLAIERPGAPPAERDDVGAVYRGRILAHLPALAGSFVALDGGVEGFLPDSAGGAKPAGTILPVQVTRAAQAGKGPRLSARIGDDMPQGAVARLAALHPSAPVELDDPALFAALRPVLGDRLARVAQAFGESLDVQLESLAESHVALPGGAAMTIHPTPALVAIDLDLAAASAGRDTKARGHEAANRAAIPALARQIRLRNLAGGIVVDFAGMSPKRRAALGSALAEALAPDPLAPRFLGFTALGLAEILRPRRHRPLHEMLAGPHAAGLAALRHAARQAAAAPHQRLALRAAPAVTDALRADPAALEAFTRAAGHPISLRPDPALPPRAWSIETPDG